MDKQPRRQRPEAPPVQIEREPDYYIDGETPVWELSDGRTVYGEGRHRLIFMPTEYVYVPAEEYAKSMEVVVDLLAHILLDHWKREAAESRKRAKARDENPVRTDRAAEGP